MKITGTIQSKTNNSIKIKNYWIKFFKEELLQGLNVGDEVEVSYRDNEKDGKVYHNGTSIKKINIQVIQNKLDTTTLNTIIMCSKDIVINNPSLKFSEVFEQMYKTITSV